MARLIRFIMVLTVIGSVNSSIAVFVALEIPFNIGNGIAYIEIENVQELQEHLREHGVRGGINLCEKLQGGTENCEYESLAINDLSRAHFDWLSESEVGSRVVQIGYYE